jgi:hypothetical protein
MPHEADPTAILPEHTSIISGEALVRLLGEVVESKRQFARGVKAITTSGPNGFPDGIDEFMQPFMSRAEHTSGMVEAMDLLAPTSDGTSWDNIASEMAEQPSAPNTAKN